MFDRKKHAPPQKRIDCLIGAGTTVQGDVTFTGGLRIDGIVRGNVTVLGPIVAESLESALALIAAATTDLTPHSDVRLLVPARCDDLVRELLVNYKLEIHSLCTYMVRGSWGGVRGYYVPTLFPESG